jgi:hypothetical protein
MFNFGTFIKLFDIPIRFSSFNWISSDNSNLNCKSLKMKNNKYKIDIHTIWQKLQPNVGTYQKFRTPCSRNMTANLRSSCFKIVKTQTKLENHETCRDAMISYVKGVIKIWQCFVKVITCDVYNLCDLHMSSLCRVLGCSSRHRGCHGARWSFFFAECQASKLPLCRVLLNTLKVSVSITTTFICQASDDIR